MNKRINIYSLIIITTLSIFFTNCQKDTNKPNNDIKISNTSVSGITQIRATVKAKIVSNGGNQITEQGVCFDTMPNPTISANKMVADSVMGDSFSVRISGLIPNKKYYARPYATNNKGTGYGDEVNFTTKTVKIGDLFEGGIVFYIDATGMHGLIAARQGLDYSSPWGCPGVAVPGTMTEIGTGKANSAAITKVCKTGGAARWSEQLVHASFFDWYLPSKDELTEMYKRKDIVIMNGAERWTSSEADANTAWALSFDAAGNAVPVLRNKSEVRGVRPIRAFDY